LSDWSEAVVGVYEDKKEIKKQEGEKESVTFQKKLCPLLSPNNQSQDTSKQHNLHPPEIRET
jgi:hypothetical protein